MNSNDFTTAERIIADVATTVGDENFRMGFSKGWYMSKVQNAVQEMSLDSKYFKPVFDYEIPTGNLQIPVPPGVFDLREIYLYNGTLCSPAKTQVVHWKRLFNNNGEGGGYTARVKDDGSNSMDPFIPNQSIATRNYSAYPGTLFYYNIHEGVLMLSESCRSFPYIRLVFNGLGGEIGGDLIIPRLFERAIVDFVEERFYNSMKARDPRKYRALWSDAKANLESYTGNWAKTVKRIKGMDQAQKESMFEYQSSFFHK